ncbi:MAG TPA: riboflavin synthase [Verrucomicrobiae bacterium]|nr:riboflavin synthase [Verrucomicrobiae bacterium]
MFSGIVSGTGTVVDGVDGGAGRLRWCPGPQAPQGLRVGDSVAVNGCCLTVAGLDGEGDAASVVADVMPETLRRTTLGRLRPGDRVNLEAALRYQDPVGGHLVTGHIDATGRVTEIRPEANAVRCAVTGPPTVLRLCVPQGSVTIDGCALTVVAVGQAELVVALIPHTREATIAGGYAVGSLVNLEADLLAKYVERLCRPAGVAGGGAL